MQAYLTHWFSMGNPTRVLLLFILTVMDNLPQSTKEMLDEHT